MPYYRCPECALTVQSVAGRFTARTCPRCSLPLESIDQTYTPEGRPAAISQRFMAEPQAASVARRALETLLWRLDSAQSNVAALLTTELIANSIEHCGAGTGGSVRLEAALTDERLRVEVGDEGPGFVPAPRAPDAPLDSHWGLHLVEELADRWGVLAEPQTLVWFELDRRPSAQATPTSEGSPALASR
jgi:anti-sigma regulatory factor (Ser/Thr protein kinase)